MKYMDKNEFLIDLDDFQNKAVSELIKYKNKSIFIKSNKYTGKTNIAKKLFNSCDDEIVFYHTGCDPKYFDKAFDRFKELINKYEYKSITIILDEFYNSELLDYLKEIDNLTCYVLTNDISISDKDYLNFNYFTFYEKFISNIYGKYLNIHEVMNKDIDFGTKNDPLRRSSTKTITNIKYKNEIKQDLMEF